MLIFLGPTSGPTGGPTTGPTNGPGPGGIAPTIVAIECVTTPGSDVFIVGGVAPDQPIDISLYPFEGTTLFSIHYRRQVVPLNPVYTQQLPQLPVSGKVLRIMLYVNMYQGVTHEVDVIISKQN